MYTFIKIIYNFIGKLRRFLWILLGVKIGKNTFIGSQVCITSPHHVIIGEFCRIARYVNIEGPSTDFLSIGNYVHINRFCWIVGGGKITIGDYVQIGPNVNIISQDHLYKGGIPILKQGYKIAPITIEEDVWIGANVVIMPGVTIGKGSIIGANAVVTRSLRDNGVYGGVPAKFIKSRS